MLSLCADWLAVLGRQPDEIALMESFLSKAAEHHVHVPTVVIQWAIWWNYNWGRVYDWDCPALFSSMEQWVATLEPPPGLPPHGSSAAKKYLFLHQIGAYDSAAAASAPVLVCSCVLCVAVSILLFWRMYCQILVLLPLVVL